MPVVLDLGPLRDPVPEAHEDVLELPTHLGHEVQVPAVPTVTPDREVDRRRRVRQLLFLERRAAIGDELFDGWLGTRRAPSPHRRDRRAGAP